MDGLRDTVNVLQYPSNNKQQLTDSSSTLCEKKRRRELQIPCADNRSAYATNP